MRIGIAAACLVLAACQASTETSPRPAELTASKIIPQSEAAADGQDWGTFYAYFTEPTFSQSANLVGLADIKQGQQIHPPHRHADEEYLIITQGRGTWYLNGETFTANTGDVLYAKPWDYHGVTAAPDSDLQFVVFKWSGTTDLPADPDPSLPEELAE